MITEEIKDQVLLSMQILFGEQKGAYITDNINIMFSNRMTSSLGIAHIKRMRGSSSVTMSLKLSAPLWERANDQEKHDTVVHEACHLADYIINGKMDGHGYNWRQYMIKCGVSPEVYHNVDTSGLRKKPKRYDVTCGCSKVHQVTKRMLNKLLSKYCVCSRCKKSFVSLS